MNDGIVLCFPAWDSFVYFLERGGGIGRKVSANIGYYRIRITVDGAGRIYFCEECIKVPSVGVSDLVADRSGDDHPIVTGMADRTHVYAAIVLADEADEGGVGASGG